MQPKTVRNLHSVLHNVKTAAALIVQQLLYIHQRTHHKKVRPSHITTETTKKVIIVHTHYNFFSQLQRFFQQFYIWARFSQQFFFGKIVVKIFVVCEGLKLIMQQSLDTNQMNRSFPLFQNRFEKVLISTNVCHFHNLR